MNLRPLALGYFRLHAADPPELHATLADELCVYADKEGLTLVDVHTDLFDAPAHGADRVGFCALMDAIRRHDAHAVILPAAEHLSRQPSTYAARRTIIEIEAGARLVVIHTRR